MGIAMLKKIQGMLPGRSRTGPLLRSYLVLRDGVVTDLNDYKLCGKVPAVTADSTMIAH